MFIKEVLIGYDSSKIASKVKVLSRRYRRLYFFCSNSKISPNFEVSQFAAGSCAFCNPTPFHVNSLKPAHDNLSRGPRQNEFRSDLYSLGVALWEMVSGHAVFRGSPADVMYQHQQAHLPLEKLEHVAQQVVVLLEVLLEKDPGRRFQNPAEFLNAMPTITGAIDARRKPKLT
jgi:hypothetical protein